MTDIYEFKEKITNFHKSQQGKINWSFVWNSELEPKKEFQQHLFKGLLPILRGVDTGFCQRGGGVDRDINWSIILRPYKLQMSPPPPPLNLPHAFW